LFRIDILLIPHLSTDLILSPRQSKIRVYSKRESIHKFPVSRKCREKYQVISVTTKKIRKDVNMKKLLSILILFYFVLPTTCFAQLNPEWLNTFGGPLDEEGACVHQTIDGGFIISGYTYSYGAGNADIWLIKTSSSGEMVWSDTLGGPGGELAGSVQQTSDGGYILTGYTGSFGWGGGDVWLIKTDSNGDTLWTKTFGGPLEDSGQTVQQTDDGGYIIIGTTTSFGAGNTDYFLIKTDSNGDSVWAQTYGGAYQDLALSGQQTSDGGYILVGYTNHAGFVNSDVWLVKTDSNGDTLWTRQYGTETNEVPYSAQQTSDDGYIITGYVISDGGIDTDVFLMKVDSNGDSLWTTNYGSSGGDAGQSVIQTFDDGYIICGYTPTIQVDANLWVIKTDSYGIVVWEDDFGGSADEIGFSIDQTLDGGYIITGTTSSFGAGGRDILLLRLDSNGISDVDNSDSKTVSSFELEQNFPNPFNPSTKIKYTIAPLNLPEGEAFVMLKVYDVLGNEVATLVNEDKPAGEYEVTFNASGFPSGIYLYKLTAGSYSAAKKMLLVK